MAAIFSRRFWCWANPEPDPEPDLEPEPDPEPDPDPDPDPDPEPEPEPDPVVVVPVAAPATRDQDGACTSYGEPGSTIGSQASQPETSEEDDPHDRAADKLLPKHKIFLSHSGAQKPFVEQLCVDLESAGHCPFFDQRQECLPPGERFPELILEAAQKCHMAVVVLSDDYLNSKWPMLELTTFVEAQRSVNPNLQIMPLFYKLGISEFKSQLRNEQLMAKWREFATKDPRIDPSKWIAALQVLSSIHGKEFAKYGGSEVAYRRASVESICRQCRPELSFHVAAMQGRKRLCDILVRKLDMLRNSQGSVRPTILGLHGMGGMGKTLICKALCNYFHSNYAGRVCHAELQMKGDIKKVFQKILRDLTDVNEGLLLRATDLYQVQELLKSWLPKRPMFLVVDNVLDVHLDTLENALPSILKSLSPKSTVIFTSRSLNVVRALVESEAHCLRVPSLQQAEALDILLQSAVPNRPLSPFKDEEMKILEMCVNRCLFSNKSQHQDSSEENGGYHPLALKALGTYLREIHPSEPLRWHEKLSIFGQWKIFHKHSVFDILRTGYDTLPTSLDKLLYMDVALFAPRQKLYNLEKLCDWLHGIHNVNKEAILIKLRLFREKSLLELWDDEETTRVVVHDLYLEFAEYEIQLEEARRWCVYQRGMEVLPNCLESSPPGSHWPDLVRICLWEISRGYLWFSGEKLKEWANVQVLCIHSLALYHLNLGPLKCLRSLDLQSDTLEILTCSSEMNQLQFVKLDCERLREGPSFKKCFNLQELAMDVDGVAIKAYNLQHVFLPYPTSLMKVVHLSWGRQLPDVLDLSHMSSLQDLRIVGSFFYKKQKFSIAGLSSLSDLRSLVLNKLPIRDSLPGLEGLTSLQYLALNGCSGLIMLPNLRTFTELKVLDVSATGITELEGVDSLPQLRGLYCVACQNLTSLPDLQSSPVLREVFTQSCKRLSRQPLVSEVCTLVTNLPGDITREIKVFLDAFGNWSRGGYSFQRVLDVCPTRVISENIPPDLIEAHQAFVDACTKMHRMADAGRTRQKFGRNDYAICSNLFYLVGIPRAPYGGLRVLQKGESWHVVPRNNLKNLFCIAGSPRPREFRAREPPSPRTGASYDYNSAGMY